MNRSRYGAIGVVDSSTGGTTLALPHGIGVEFQLFAEAFREERKNVFRRIFLISFFLLHAPGLVRSTPSNFDYIFHGDDKQRSGSSLQPPLANPIVRTRAPAELCRVHPTSGWPKDVDV